MSAAPDHLSAAASDIWAQAVAELGGDWHGERRLQLEIFCCERARWLAAEFDLATDGAVIVTRNDKGEVRGMQAHPAIAISDRARKAMVEAWQCIAAAASPPTQPGTALTYEPADEFELLDFVEVLDAVVG